MAGLALLIVGGTRFLGRLFVAAALAGGHGVTLLHRGQSGPGLFPEVEHLIADRNGDLAVLEGRRFDAVIDPSACVPRHVRTLAARLAGRVGSYQCVSSISAYAGAAPAHEDAPLVTLASVHGGPMLAPGPAHRPVQLIHVRDAAVWVLRQAEQGT